MQSVAVPPELTELAGHFSHFPPDRKWSSSHELAAEQTSDSISPLPDPGTCELASLVLPPVHFTHFQVPRFFTAYMFSPHVQNSAVPPSLVEPSGQVWHALALPSKYCQVSHAWDATHSSLSPLG